MNAELIVLRAIHVYGAVEWAGSSLFVAFFLIPAIGMVGQAYSIGTTFALATFVVFMAVNHPAIGRMMALGRYM